jgi:RHS repeat-associated protein
VEERRFVYDEGWNVLGETVSVNGAAPVLDRRYVWGLDLSGTETGAGGVHGLVASVRPGAPEGTRRELPVYDGNGNVERVVTETGEVSARYEYGPFGEEITRRGVGAQPYRFSTKYHDEETGLLYYGYRYYAPRLGRWLNRDPIEEGDGPNLYAMVHNNPVNIVDIDGRTGWQLDGPWDHDHFDPHLPGPGEEFIVVVAVVTILTPIPGDEVAVGSVIGGWVVKQVISKGGQAIAQGSKCCRAVKVVVEKLVKKAKGRNPKDYTEKTRDALNDAFKGGYDPNKLNNMVDPENWARA